MAEDKTGTSKLVFELYKNHSVFFLYYVIIMFRRCLSCSDFIATICQPSFFVLLIIFIMSCLVDLSWMFTGTEQLRKYWSFLWLCTLYNIRIFWYWKPFLKCWDPNSKSFAGSWCDQCFITKAYEDPLKPIIRHRSIHRPATLQLCGTVMFCPIAVKIHLYR